MPLSIAERKLAAVLLDRAADEFSNHGCNDFHAKRDGGLTDEEIAEIKAKLYGPEEMKDFGNSEYFMDWWLMQYLRKRILEDLST